MSDYFGQITSPAALAITPTSYTVPRTSALALDMLKLSLVKNSAALLKAGISNPLARPASGTGLYYTIYDLVKDYAVSLLRRSVPFYYKTITGETRAVESTTRANAAIDYIPQTMKNWGYVRTTVRTSIAEPTPVYTPPYTPPVEPTPVEAVTEEEAILWAVSYTLAEAGFGSYPIAAGGRVGVSQQDYDRLVDRAKYIAGEMIRQNTLSPRL